MNLAHPDGPVPEDGQHQQPRIIIVKPQEPTFVDAARQFAHVVVANFLICAIAAMLGSYVWNSLVELHGLTDIDFNTAFAVAVLLRLVGLLIRL